MHICVTRSWWVHIRKCCHPSFYVTMRLSTRWFYIPVLWLSNSRKGKTLRQLHKRHRWGTVSQPHFRPHTPSMDTTAICLASSVISVLSLTFEITAAPSNPLISAIWLLSSGSLWSHQWWKSKHREGFEVVVTSDVRRKPNWNLCLTGNIRLEWFIQIYICDKFRWVIFLVCWNDIAMQWH